MKDRIPEKVRPILGGVVCAAVFVLILAGIFLPSAPGFLLPAAAIAAAGFSAAFLGAGIRAGRRLQEAREQLYHCDRSTGLANGDKLIADFKQLKDVDGHAFVLLTLNGFERIGTLFGTVLAGRTIQKLCPSLEKFADRQGGTAYRLSPDRFALLTPVKNQTQYLTDLKQLFHSLEQVCVEDKHISYSYHYTFSYGVYFTSPADKTLDDLESLVLLTNSAVKRVKSEGETVCTVFSEESKPDWELQRVLSNHVEAAWNNREFVPYYQLVYDLKTGKPVGAELLTRWQFPGRGLVMPGDFIPVMESAGLIMDLDLYMLEEACKHIKAWVDAELVTVPLSVNISKLNIHRKDFVDRVISIVKSYDIPPILLELELTESVLLYEKNDSFLALAQRMHDFGLTISMDNFAANDFSSIDLLRDVPVDVVKVANRFFRHVQDSKRDRAFVQNVLRMAKEMKIKVVAMGVETEEQAELCKQLGVVQAQGYYFSKPVSNEEFEKQIF